MHFLGEDNEWLVQYCRRKLQTQHYDYFLFGHRHIDYDLMLSRTARVIILGDWITLFTYAVFDGEHLFLEEYIEGETEP